MSLNPSSRIIAIFATMNRAATAKECLRCLSAQTVHPAMVVVTDNASSDDTVEALRGFAVGLGMSVDVIASEINLGNAGGIERAMERAFRDGADHVWILDDDSWPEPGALEALLGEDGPEDGIRSSVVLTPGEDSGSWPLEVPGRGRGWKIDWNPVKADSPDWLRVRRSWLGALIPREAYEKVGPVNGELFLRGEDEDYPRRLSRLGYDFWLCTHSVLRHPQAGSLMVLECFGQRVCLERDLTGDKLYYRLRNMLWIKKSEAGALAAGVLAIGYGLVILLKEERTRRQSLRTLVESAGDAFRNRLGKRI